MDAVPIVVITVLEIERDGVFGVGGQEGLRNHDTTILESGRVLGEVERLAVDV